MFVRPSGDMTKSNIAKRAAAVRGRQELLAALKDALYHHQIAADKLMVDAEAASTTGSAAETVGATAVVQFDELDRIMHAAHSDPFGVLAMSPAPRCVFDQLSRQDIEDHRAAALTRLGCASSGESDDARSAGPRSARTDPSGCNPRMPIEEAISLVESAARILTGASRLHQEAPGGASSSASYDCGCRACWRTESDHVPYVCDPYGALTRPITNVLHTVVNKHALKDFIETERDGASNEWPESHQSMSGVRGDMRLGFAEFARKLLDECPGEKKPTRTVFASHEVAYRHSSLGAALVNAGFLSHSREYAIQSEPFSRSPRLVRKIAFRDVGPELDDKACYPHAQMHLLRTLLQSHPTLSAESQTALARGIQASEALLQNLEPILSCLAERLLPGLPAADGRDAAKALINAIDMDGTVKAWGRRNGASDSDMQGLPSSFPGCVRDTQVSFSLRAYVEAQRGATRAIATALPAMHAYIQRWWRLRGDPRAETPERTLKSYVLQSYEGLSRTAKLAYARGVHWPMHGELFLPISLQHDGVLFASCITEGEASKIERFRRGVQDHCSRRLGYAQPVAVKN